MYYLEIHYLLTWIEITIDKENHNHQARIQGALGVNRIHTYKIETNQNCSWPLYVLKLYGFESGFSVSHERNEGRQEESLT